MSDPVRHLLDASGVAAIVAALAGWVPPLAGFVAILWYCIQIYESKTFQKLLVKQVEDMPGVSEIVTNPKASEALQEIADSTKHPKVKQKDEHG